MKGFYIIAIIAALLLTTGCGSSPSSNRYIDIDEAAEQTIESTPAASEIPTQTTMPDADKQVNPESIEEALLDDKRTEEQPAEKSPAPAKELTKPEKLQEAKKNNEAAGKAVTDSIMDKSEAPTADNPKAVQLKQAIELIRTHIKDLKQYTENENTEKIIEVISLITQDWLEVQVDVKSSYPDMFDFLQDKIDQLSELQSGEVIDMKEMLQLDYELYQAFRQLADKLGA